MPSGIEPARPWAVDFESTASVLTFATPALIDEVFWKTSLLYLRHSVVQQRYLQGGLLVVKDGISAGCRICAVAGESRFISALNNNIFICRD